MAARQQRRAQVKRQDYACRSGKDYLLLSDNVIQLGKDRAENPKLFKTRVSRYRFGQTSHQEEPGGTLAQEIADGIRAPVGLIPGALVHLIGELRGHLAHEIAIDLERPDSQIKCNSAD
jgi:hypothetical protein